VLRGFVRHTEGEKPMSTVHPPDPIAAVTHPDPYPYYAELVACRPLYRDETLGLWVASSAAAVSAALASDACRVRPPAEPVPGTLLGSPAADLFRRLVRMNDGAHHDALKRALAAALHSTRAAQVLGLGRTWAYELLGGRQPQDAAFHLSVYVIASLLGVPEDRLHQTALWIGDVVRCLAPASTPAQIDAGKLAAGHLLALFRSLLRASRAETAGSLLATLAEQAKSMDCEDEEAIAANGIGLLSQAYEAAAGLIGNTLVTLATHPEVRAQVGADAGLLPSVLQEVLRCDPPVQNTRRFLGQDGVVAGQPMQAGDAVLVVLAAANRDPAANPYPERFDPRRNIRRLFTFGAGIHACPGDTLAVLIAQAGIEVLLASQHDLESLITPVTYRPSANVRIALLTPALQR
jgi:cytochrome P450